MIKEGDRHGEIRVRRPSEHEVFTRGIPRIPRLQPCHSDLHLHPLMVTLRAKRDPRGRSRSKRGYVRSVTSGIPWGSRATDLWRVKAIRSGSPHSHDGAKA